MSTPYREFDPNSVLDKLQTKSVALNDYDLVNDNLARVVLAYTGDWTKDEFLQKVTAMFDSHAVPVRDSFKRLTDNSVVGFVFSQPDIRTFDKEDENKYRPVTANVLMDRDDESTWELKEGASGKYLCRHGMEDLSELAKGMYNKRVGYPTIRQLASEGDVAPQEFVAYVDPDEGEVSYGYAIERDKDAGTVAVLSYTTQEVQEVSDKLIIHATNLMGEDQKMANLELAANSDKSAMEQYYKKLFNYAPDYIAEIMKMINQHAFA